MTIESIRIVSFGRLRNYSCTFGPGVNILEGANESGKSTLAAFIRYILYGFPAGRGGALSEKKKRINWQDGAASGSMIVRVGEKRYRLERSTTATAGAQERETYRERCRIIDLATNTPVGEGAVPGELFLHVPEEIYMNTAFVQQIGSPRPSQEITGAIENLLFSGDENVSAGRALEKLENVRRSLLHKNGKGGELYRLEEKEQDLGARLLRAEAANAQILQSETELAQQERDLSEAQEELARLRAAEAEARNVVYADEFARLHAEEEKAEACRQALRNMEGMPAHLLQESDLYDLQSATDRAEAGEGRLTEARGKRVLCETAPFEEEEGRDYLETVEREGGCETLLARYRQARKGCIGGAVLLALSLLALVGGGVAAIALPGAFATSLVYAFAGVWILGGILLAVGLGLYLPAAGRMRRICRSYALPKPGAFFDRYAGILRAREALARYRAALSEAQQAEAAARDAYNRSLSELDTVVRRFGSRLPEEDPIGYARTRLSDAKRMMEAKKDKERELHRAETVIRELLPHLRNVNEEEILSALPKGRVLHAEDVNPEKLREQMESRRRKTEELQARKQGLEKQIGEARARTEDPALLQSELEELRLEEAALREKYEACRMAYEALQGAGTRLREHISPRLAEYMGRMMECLTDGQYQMVGVEQNLNVMVNTGEATYSLEYLSAGTQDLMYLSLRMALIDLLYREEKPPVCFDESFVYQDDARAARMMELLFLLAEQGQQSLVFTCHSREREEALRMDAAHTNCIVFPD